MTETDTAPRTEAVPENVGVINPYALTEAIRGERLDWDKVDARQVLPETLEKPYEQLFDPKYDSPLYTGLAFNRETLKMESRPVRLAIGRAGIVEVAARRTDAEAGGQPSDADRPTEARQPAEILAGVAASAAWQDVGTFFNETAEFFDPVQGAVGDCYFIAALSSVAWAKTYEISQHTRATGVTQQQFVDMITFYNSNAKALVEVGEAVPVNGTGKLLFARSSEPGEVWPAIYEKAYAKWRTNDSTDTPNILAIAGGDPVAAAHQLTGLTPSYYATASLTADVIYQRVRENCISCKTFNPTVAWTYPSGDASPDKVNYSNANLVANHAYSILGWDYRNGLRYIILRNPWGQTEATADVLTGTWTAWDAPYYGGPGWWRSINLSANDGTFGLQVETFKRYFAAFGVVK